MAVETQEGFSIREYVSRMRIVNVVKCWPFDEATSEESVQSLLPPITFKKFIWWLDGLEYLHSQSSKNVDNSKKRKKKLVEEKGESSLRKPDFGEGNDVVKAKSWRAKAKAPKKRSVSQIFAVSAQVESISSDQEEENSVEKEDGFCINASELSYEEVNWGIKGKRKKKKKNKEIFLDNLNKRKKVIKANDAEKCLVFKLQDQDRGIGIPNSWHTRKNENDIRNHVSIHKKKQHLGCKDLRLHQGNPKRGILKNHTKTFSLGGTTECILHKADKHVTFVKKDTIRGLNRKPSDLPLESFKLQNNCGSEMHNRIENEMDARQHHDEEEPLSLSRCVNISGEKQHLFDREMSRYPKCICPPEFYCMAIMNEDLGTCGPRFPQVCVEEYLRTHNEPSVSHPSETFRHLSPRELQQTTVCSVKRNLNEDFVRLPLNSRGELITLSSSVNKIGSTAASPSIISCNTLSEYLVKNSQGRSWDSSRDQLNLSPFDGYLKVVNDHLENSLCEEDNRATMRLMGKEFMVGGKGFQGFGDGHIWKDEQIISELHSSNGLNLMHYSNEPCLEKLRETSVFPSENHGIASMYDFHHFDCHTSLMHMNDLVARKVTSSNQEASSSFVNSTSVIRVINKQNHVPHAPISAVRFPFMHPDLKPHVQSAWSGSPHENGSLLYFDASEKGGSTSNFHPCTIPGEHEAFGLYNSFPVGSIPSVREKTWKSEENQGTDQVKNWY